MQRIKWIDPVHWSRNDEIITGVKLLDIKYEFYGFSGDFYRDY